MSSNDEKTSFCFINGEPSIYISKTKQYIPIDSKEIYHDLLQYTKERLLSFKKRPKMIEIWKIVSDFFGTSNYAATLSIKSSINENSFENRFTREITEFIDIIFKRGLSNEEKKQRKDYEKKLSIRYRKPDWVIQARIRKEKRNKYSAKKLR